MKKLALTNSHLAKGTEIHETDKLILESAKKKGLETILVNPNEVNYFLIDKGVELDYKNKNLKNYDILVTRRMRGAEKQIYELVKSMELNGNTTVDSSESLIFPLNKYLSQLERKNSVGHPRTTYFSNLGNNAKEIMGVWNFPFVLKPNEGREGQGVVIIWSKESLEE